MKKYDKRLNDIKSVNTELSRIYNDCNNGVLAQEKARTLVSILSKKIDAFRVQETLDMEKERLSMDKEKLTIEKTKAYGFDEENLPDDNFEASTRYWEGHDLNTKEGIEALFKDGIDKGIVDLG